MTYQTWKTKFQIYLKSSSDHEVLLFQTKFFAFEEVIVRVQNTGDVFSRVTIQDGLDVITVIDYYKVLF